MDPAKLEYFRTVKEITGRSNLVRPDKYRLTMSDPLMQSNSIKTGKHADLCLCVLSNGSIWNGSIYLYVISRVLVYSSVAREHDLSGRLREPGDYPRTAHTQVRMPPILHREVMLSLLHHEVMLSILHHEVMLSILNHEVMLSILHHEVMLSILHHEVMLSILKHRVICSGVVYFIVVGIL